MLVIHRAERADRLVGALASVFTEPLDDPFAAEVVAVPTRGVERWVVQQLATTLGASVGRADGVCANVRFPFPGKLVGGAVATASGLDPDTDPWLPERSVWPLLDVVDAGAGDPALGPLHAHLAGPEAGARRFAAVRHVADLFDRYGLHRPEMVRAWASGDDTGSTGRPLDPDAAWQAELWRRLRVRIGAPSPAERIAAACERLRAEPAVVGHLPSRFALFGLTRLPASYLEVLHALAAHRAVHLFLLHPSPELWARLSPAPAGLPLRRDDGTAALVANPLLASWGHDAREMQLVLTGGVAPGDDRHHPLPDAASSPAVGGGETGDGAGPTVLARLQADVRANRPPPGAPVPGQPDTRPVLAADDRSLQVHACHGRARQVEVLRDAIAHLLAADPRLEPRDVVVMCPDIDAFAPLIQASFGSMAEPDDDAGGSLPATGGRGSAGPPDLRVRLADRALRQTNPVLGMVAELLELAPSRVTASQVVDFAGRDPVRRRFGFDDDDDLARVEEWVAATGARWGFDAAHRAPFQLDAVVANTWRAGLDRLLVGVTMSEDDRRLVGGVLPLDDVDSSDIDLAGRLAELLDRLQAAVDAFGVTRTIAGWAAAIAEAADALGLAPPTESWQRVQLQELLDGVTGEATVDGSPSPALLTLADVASLLGDRLKGRPTRASFRTGHLTMCTLVPMRSVPHRVVGLLGLDDGVFPRRTAPDGDDLISRHPRVGDRDTRSEDRQLLLDALLAASDHLVVTYTGRDERTNAEVPPAVPLGELLDVVGDTVQGQVVVHHPLQPFDARNFVAGRLVPGRPWSFDTVDLAGAVASARGAGGPRGAFLDGLLEPVDTDLVELDDLVRFVQHPTKAFLRRRLGIALRDGEDETADAMAVELDGLQKWGVGQRLLEARLAGLPLDACRAAEVARGALPPGRLGQRVLDEVSDHVERIVAVAEKVASGVTTSVEVNVEMEGGAGCTIVGTVTDLVGDVLRPVTYSSLAAKHRMAAWVRLLALGASRPEVPGRVAAVGRYGRKVRVSEMGPLADSAEGRRAAARAQLAMLVDLYRRGLREPLPLYCDTSAAYAAFRNRKGARPAIRKAWESERDFDHEDRDLEHQLVWGKVATLDEVMAVPPQAGETGDGWGDERDTSRFERYARRLWDGLLAYEQIGTW